MILADTVLLVVFHVQVDSEGEESGSRPRPLEDFAVHDVFYGGLCVWDELGQISFPESPSLLSHRSRLAGVYA